MNYSLEKSICSLFIRDDINTFFISFKRYYSQLHNYILKTSKIIAYTKDAI